MKVTNLNWLSAQFTPHNVSQVTFNAADVAQAYTVANRKVAHTNDFDPNGRTRAHQQKLIRLVAGELADLAVLQLINNHFRESGQGAVAEEYDSVRTDQFVDSSPYSIHVKRDEIIDKLIEVRSSFCYRLPLADMITSRLSIYGWYTSYGKPQEDPKDLYFQVFYHLRPASVKKEDKWPDVEVFEDCLAKGEVVAYVVGGAERDFLNSHGTTKKDDADGAFYRAIYPADTGRDINYMLNLC